MPYDAPTEKQLEDARTFAVMALTQDSKWPVAARLEDYYELRGNYAGSTFSHLQDVHPSSVDPRRITVTDLHAVSLLSVRVPPAATRALIDNVDGRATTVNASLAALDDLGVRHLRDADQTVLEAMETVVVAITEACKRRGTKGISNPWVLVSKIAARKAPDLFPVRDNIVCTALGLIGRGKPQGSWRIDWQVYRALLLDGDVRAGIVAAQDELNTRDEAEYGREQDELRVLDAAMWTYEMQRIKSIKAERATEGQRP